LEETLISLSEGNQVIKADKKEADDTQKDQNPFWNDLDTQSKIGMVNEANNKLKEAGVINGKFCVKTEYVLDKDTCVTKPFKTTPIFYGEVTQFEHDTIQTCAANFQTTYHFNGFVYNLKVMKIGESVDF